MSENSLKKHIDNGTTRVNNTLNFTPAFVSDSKDDIWSRTQLVTRLNYFAKVLQIWDDIKDCGSKITFKNSLQNIQESGFTFGLERDFTAKSDLYIKLDTEASAEKLHQNLKLLHDNLLLYMYQHLEQTPRTPNIRRFP